MLSSQKKQSKCATKRTSLASCQEDLSYLKTRFSERVFLASVKRILPCVNENRFPGHRFESPGLPRPRPKASVGRVLARTTIFPVRFAQSKRGWNPPPLAINRLVGWHPPLHVFGCAVVPGPRYPRACHAQSGSYPAAMK